MTYSRRGQAALDYDLCRYDGSKLEFRGPVRSLDADFVAFLGGTETFGKFIPMPYPDLVEHATGMTCVNFGWPNAGLDVFAHDAALLDCAARARLSVLQVPCAINMSNQFYTVHPRRNDRFLKPAGMLRDLFAEVDFTEFHFNRHMLSRLQNLSPKRFGFVMQELTEAWVNGMQGLLKQLNGPVVLLWFSARSPDEKVDQVDLASDPSLVNREMLEELKEDCLGWVEVCIGEEFRNLGTNGMVYTEKETAVAAKMLGPKAHEMAAEKLSPLIAELIRD